MKVLRLIAVLLGLVVSSVVFGGEFELANMDSLSCEQINGSSMCLTLLYSGKIERGDNKKLVSEIERLTQGIEKIFRAKDPEYSVRIGEIIFDSPGGDLFEAMKVGRTIRDKLIGTINWEGGNCYSACVVAFLGGVTRLAFGTVGIHSFYSEEFIGQTEYNIASKRYDEVAEVVEAYLKSLRIPTAFLDEMKATPHYSVKVLDSEEMKRLGVMGVDPVYAQVRESSRKKATQTAR